MKRRREGIYLLKRAKKGQKGQIEKRKRRNLSVEKSQKEAVEEDKKEEMEKFIC